MNATSAATIPPETERPSRIQQLRPLGEQIIIRTIPVDSLGSIIIPDSAKRITVASKGEKQPDAFNFVEAEVIAVGPGKRMKGEPGFIAAVSDFLNDLISDIDLSLASRSHQMSTVQAKGEAKRLLQRAENVTNYIPPLVKPGDRILYHPAVQRFDRDITDLMQQHGDLNSGSRYFIIREDSVLAVIARD